MDSCLCEAEELVLCYDSMLFCAQSLTDMFPLEKLVGLKARPCLNVSLAPSTEHKECARKCLLP